MQQFWFQVKQVFRQQIACIKNAHIFTREHVVRGSTPHSVVVLLLLLLVLLVAS